MNQVGPQTPSENQEAWNQNLQVCENDAQFMDTSWSHEDLPSFAISLFELMFGMNYQKLFIDLKVKVKRKQRGALDTMSHNYQENQRYRIRILICRTYAIHGDGAAVFDLYLQNCGELRCKRKRFFPLFDTSHSCRKNSGKIALYTCWSYSNIHRSIFQLC